MRLKATMSAPSAADEERGAGPAPVADGAAGAVFATSPLRPPTQLLSVEASRPAAAAAPTRPGFLARARALVPGRGGGGGGAGFTRLASTEAGGTSSSSPSSPSLSPEDTASLPSRLLFRFVDGLVAAGTAKPLETDDLWPVSRRDAATPVSARFAAALADPAAGGSLAAAAWAVHGRAFVGVGLLKLVHDIFLFSGPFFLERLLRHLSSGGPASTAWLLAASLALVAGLETLTINAYFHALYRIGAHLKASLVDTLFTAALDLSSSARDGTGSGPVATLLSNDAAKLWGLPQYLHMLWSAPFQVAVALGLLVRILGWAPSLIGLGVTAALIPVTTAVTKRLAKLRKGAMAATDARVKAAAEVVAGVRAVKLYAWEDAYTARIGAARAKEVAAVRHLGMVNVFNNVLFGGAPVLISLAALLMFAGRGGAITPAVAFPALALFNLLRFPVIMFPRQLTDIIAGRVALGRLQRFLGAERVPGRAVLPPAPRGAADAVVVSGAAFAWSRGDAASTVPPTITLRVPSLRVRAGDLVVVVGDVGAGKSSLLAALLGEMVAIEGTVSVAGAIAYAAQDPWIRNQSVRANITWEDWPAAAADGEGVEDRPRTGPGTKNNAATAADPAWYDTVLDACALRPDLASWPAGDDTEIGEKGVTLSGGQRARVALARAVFARADTYLLDDPLSAVDAHVGSHLWEACLTGVLAGSTRILVTHQVQYAGRADTVVVVRGGAVVDAGPPGGVDLSGVAAPPAVAAAAAAAADGANGTGSGPPTPPRGDTAPVAPRHADASADGGGGGGGGDQGTPGGAEWVSTAAAFADPPPSAAAPAPVVVRPPLPANPPGTVIVPTGDGGGVAVLPADQQHAEFVELGLGEEGDGGGRAALLGGGRGRAAPPSSSSPEIKPAPLELPTSSPAKANGVGAPPALLRPAPPSSSLAASPPGRQPPSSLSTTLSGRVVKAEERAVGSVHRSVYRVYLAAWGGWALPRWCGACLPRQGAAAPPGSLLAAPPPRPALPLPAIVVAISAAERGLQVAQNLFLAAWADRTAAALSGGGTGALPGPGRFMAVYASLGAASLAAQAARAVVTVEGSTTAAAALHDRLLHRVIRLPMSFFDSQPSGRLLNRCEKGKERGKGEGCAGPLSLPALHPALHPLTPTPSIPSLSLSRPPLSLHF